MIGTTLSHFRITAKLGAGGMGDVYRAEDTKLGREVAIKVLPEEMASDPERLERFQREAKALAALDHPNIVSIYSVESVTRERVSPYPTEAESVHFLVMGLVDGGPLDQSMADGGLPMSDIFELALPLVDAVAAAHEKGIVHRDLKPANVMVTDEGRVKVLDFGLAKLTESEADPEMTQMATEALTQQGMVMGTVPYMSPEQIEGKPVDHRSDIFSLGILLYQMATGERPFQGDTSPALMSSIMKDVPSSVIEVREDLPRHFGRILNRCLEKDPEDRYQTSKDLLADLKNLKRETESESISAGTPAPAVSKRRPWVGIAAGAVLLLVAAIAAFFPYPRQTDQISSLAVLPFENGSGDPDTEYFSDGVTETIISSLSQLPDMKVISRTSAFHYKGQVVDPEKVGQELGVEALVLGRIVQRGDDLMVSAELVRASDSGQIWGQQYQRQTADIFDIQREIAKEISAALKLELTSNQEDRLTRQHTENSVAYEAYLKGRQSWNLRTETGFRQAIEHFQTAIAADPGYALAHSGLADCYSLLGYYFSLPNDVYPQARAAAERAIELDDGLAEAHTSLAWIQLMYDWEFEEAQRGFDRALEINPSYGTAWHWSAIGPVAFEDYDEGVERMRRATEFDPLSRIINSEFAAFLGYADRIRESEVQFQVALDLDPGFPHLYLRRGWGLELQGRYDEAVAAYEKGTQLLGALYGLGQLGHAYAKAGRTEEARAIGSRLEDLRSQQYVSPLEIANVYSGLGELDRAFEWLETAFEERTNDLLLVELRFAPDLGADPRFKDLKQRIGLP